MLLLSHQLIAPHRSTRCRRRSDPRSGICSVVCADTEPAKWLYSRLLAWQATLTMTLKFPHIDSHLIARNSRIHSQTPKNVSHFAMRITLFSPLLWCISTCCSAPCCSTGFVYFAYARGIATGVDIGIYTPKISPSKLFTG